jgi:hypothetical protein
VQRPGPPILVGGSGTRLLRVAAEHADIWNVPGPPHASLEFVTERSRVLDQHCADIGRDPASLTRSPQLLFPVTDAAVVRATIAALIATGFGHFALAVQPPWPDNVARWLADEIINPVRSEVAAAAGGPGPQGGELPGLRRNAVAGLARSLRSSLPCPPGCCPLPACIRTRIRVRRGVRSLR